MEPAPPFILITCQVGAEAAVKAELARNRPDFRFAYSRPGFLTFKLPPNHGLTEACDLESVFARAASFSLGRIKGDTVQQRAESVAELCGPKRFDRLHVWQRDLVGPNYRPDYVQPPASVAEADEAIRRLWPAEAEADITPAAVRQTAGASRQHAAAAATEPLAPIAVPPTRRGDLVLDCVLIQPDEWWLGYHRAERAASCWPGGLFYYGELPADTVSRAYLKMEEGLAWSQLPIQDGNICVELGSAPGGASQALLRHGLRVIGIDPADMDPRVLAEPNFVHWKKRGQDLRRREFRKVRWLTADMNVVPPHTLDVVEAIVTHREVHVEGMLLTLKLLDWSLAAEVPAYLERIRSWGYAEVTARQLHHNRREICVAAVRKPAIGRKRSGGHKGKASGEWGMGSGE